MLSYSFRLEVQPQLKKNEKSVQLLISLAVDEFYPYISRCFQAVFKPASVSLVFGRSSLVTDHPHDSAYSLDIDSINEPLSEFLPEKVAVDQGVEVDIKCSADDEEFGKNERTKQHHNENDKSKVTVQGSKEKLMKRISSDSYDETTQNASDLLNFERKQESLLSTHEPNIS